MISGTIYFSAAQNSTARDFARYNFSLSSLRQLAELGTMPVRNSMSSKDIFPHLLSLYFKR